ncbi:tRNA 2-thiouridine(34) synthase MnmA [Planctomycetota bacterium]
MIRRRKIVVAMSGGVDSSTAAALLKEQGHDVIGVCLRFVACGSMTPGEKSCCGTVGINDARRVAARLDMPFHVLNYEDVFEQHVIDYFCESYMSGKTPNPCVECNRVVKFGRLLELTEALGAEHVATGHYARIDKDEHSGRYVLKKGRDPEKDQSYFLYPLSQQQLSRILFPLGEITKDETRKIAARFDLPVAEKPGSQDICFVGDKTYREFLEERHPESFRPGPIVDTDGRVLGEHPGIACFTVGQRRGVKVAAGVPLYVLSVDAEKNTVVLGKREDMLTQRISVAQTNWIPFSSPSGPVHVGAKIRYRHPEIAATVERVGNGHSEVRFDEPQMIASAPGQSAVFYDGDVVVGGGIIE